MVRDCPTEEGREDTLNGFWDKATWLGIAQQKRKERIHSSIWGQGHTVLDYLTEKGKEDTLINFWDKATHTGITHQKRKSGEGKMWK